MVNQGVLFIIRGNWRIIEIYLYFRNRSHLLRTIKNLIASNLFELYSKVGGFYIEVVPVYSYIFEELVIYNKNAVKSVSGCHIKHLVSAVFCAFMS